MKKLTIFVDMDGTIENLLEVWLDKLNKKYNRNVKYEDVNEWDISKQYPGISYDDVMRVLYDDSIWEEVKPIDGAYEVLKKWYEDGHNVYIVTASSYKSLESKMTNVLFKYFPFIDWKHVIVTENKQLLNGDILIDDGIHNLIGGNYNKILLDAPYNRNVDDEKYGIIRAKDWNEIDSTILKMINYKKGEL